MSLTGFAGEQIEIQETEVIRYEIPQKVYNFSIEGTENYYVGEQGVLVHNVEGCPPGNEVKKKNTETKQTDNPITKESINTKLEKYLLNKDHPIGGSKANWFEKALGFNQNNKTELANQIVFNPQTAIETQVTEYGTKYNQIINIKGANGRNIDVNFSWIKNNDGIIRLVTEIPTKK